MHRIRAALLLLASLGPGIVAQGVDDRPDRRVRDAGLQNRINEAIFRGIEYLEQSQNDDGSWTYRRPDGHGGLTALALYALAASGLRSDRPSIVRGVAWLEQNDRFFSEDAARGTYSASLLILALTRIDAKRHQRLIRRCMNRIVAGQLRNGQWTYRLWDGKTTSASSMRQRRAAEAWQTRTGDNSNSQFAVLGLWAAEALGGCRVPHRTWRKVAAFYRRTQLRDGRWSYRPPPETLTVAGPAKAAAGAKPRRYPGKPSMTAAGLVSWVYAQAAMGGGIRSLPAARKTLTAERGLKAFLADGKRGWNWNDLYLAYAVERVGTVLAVPQDRWYVQGARRLVGSQLPNGRWRRTNFGDTRSVYETSLALLFLSKATAPAITGGRSRGR